MTLLVFSVGAFWLYCGVMSLLAREDDRPLLQSPAFHLGSAALFVLLMSLSAYSIVRTGHPLVTVPAATLVIIFGVLFGLRYWTMMFGEYIERAHAAALGVGNMKVRKTYDKAEKAEREGDLEGALGLYQGEAAQDPSDPEPLRRMAEIRVRQGDLDRAAPLFRAALPLVESPEDRTTLAFRLSDLLVRADRRDEARRVLEELAGQVPGTRWAEYAEARLKGLS